MKKFYFILFFFILIASKIFLYLYQLPKTDFYYYYYQVQQYLKPIKDLPDYQNPLQIRNYYSKPGDNLWNIAKRFNLNIDTIVSFNEFPKVHVIRPKLAIKIPSQDGILFKKEKNETMEELSERYNIPLKKLFYYNPDFYSQVEVFLPDAYYDLDIRMGKLGSEFLKPLKEIKITSLFGLRIHPITKKRQFHQGVDIRGKYGEMVYSSKGGRVIFARETPGLGKVVVISHNKGYVTKYAHMSSVLVKAGQNVSAQHPIGKVGITGLSTGPHLHFEVWKNGRPIDPRDVTDFY